VILPFALAGIPAVLKKSAERGSLLVVWFACAPVLISIDFSLQRRLIEGVWVVLVTLALAAFERTPWKWFRRASLLGVFSLPTTLLLLVGGVDAARTITTPVFYAADEVAAYRFVAQEAEEDTVVLSGYEAGNALPAWAAVFVVMGHRPESAGMPEIEPRVEAFFQEGTEEGARTAILKEFGVDYVLWGPGERAYGGWDPRSAGYLEAVFEDGRYVVFRVVGD